MNRFLQALLDRRAAIQSDLDALLAGAETRLEERRAETRAANPTLNDAGIDALVGAALTEDEQTRMDQLLADRAPLDTQIESLRRAEQRADDIGPTRPARVIREEHMYDRHRPERSFFLDLARAQIQSDPAARARLERHRDEMNVDLASMDIATRSRFDSFLGETNSTVETRDITRTDGAGGDFVPPLWLMELYTEVPRGARPVADIVRQIPLPGGTDSINVPKILTGTTVRSQTADLAAPSETDITTGSVACPVQTLAGQQDLAIQLLDQSPLAFDRIVFADLYADLEAQVDTQVLNGSGSSGQLKGILNASGIVTVTYTDASPTLSELYPKLADSINQAGTNRKRPPTHQIMAFRRWLWALAAVDSTGRPYVTANPISAANPLGQADQITLGGTAGGMLLTPTVADVNMPTNLGAGTNEDRVITLKADDLILFEGQTRARVLTEVLSGNLAVRLQVYRYAAFTAERYPSGIAVVAGTGLVTPTF